MIARAVRSLCFCGVLLIVLAPEARAECLGWSGTEIPGMNQAVTALCWYDDGTGPSLYAGGAFTQAGGVFAGRIARWDGAQWHPVGAPFDGQVSSFAVFDDGTGPALYAGGQFTHVGDLPVDHVAKWDGESWTEVGVGITGVTPDVVALCVYDDGTGPALYAGGAFESAGGFACDNIAKWDGINWSPLGEGTYGGFPIVRAFATFDDGSGEQLYVGGGFTYAGDGAVNYIARWDGSTWSDVDGGMSGGFAYVSALTVYDDGRGPALFASGNFDSAGGIPADNVARWDGAAWSALGLGVNSRGYAFASYETPEGVALHLAGAFSAAGDAPAGMVARWDGTQWHPVGEGIGDGYYVACLEVIEDADGDSLLVAGGQFFEAAGRPADRIATWRCREDVIGNRGDSNCDQSVDFADINPFIAALSGEASWRGAVGDVACDYYAVNDTNRDGVVDFGDINPFIACLGGDCP